MGAPYWRLINRYAPGCRVLVVRRPIPEVLESVKKQGIQGVELPKLLDRLIYLDHKLDQIEERLPNTISVNFDELNDYEVASIAFEHCTGMSLSVAWWAHWQHINVQADFDAVTRYTWTHLKQLASLSYSAAHQMRADLTSRAPAKIDDGLEINEESFVSSFPDAEGLVESHCLAIGQPADEWTRNNIPLFQAMDETGCLQVLTARANGKMFGYLVSILGPSTESMTDRSATHTLFYASQEWPGAGLRLQREALHRLKDKGIAEVVMRSWLGAGARIEALYKRIGAERDGSLYRIRLES